MEHLSSPYEVKLKNLFLALATFSSFSSMLRMDVFFHDVLSDHMDWLKVSHPLMRLRWRTIVWLWQSFLYLHLIFRMYVCYDDVLSDNMSQWSNCYLTYEVTMKNYCLALPIFSSFMFHMHVVCVPLRCSVWPYSLMEHLSSLHQTKMKTHFLALTSFSSFPFSLFKFNVQDRCMPLQHAVWPYRPLEHLSILLWGHDEEHCLALAMFSSFSSTIRIDLFFHFLLSDHIG